MLRFERSGINQAFFNQQIYMILFLMKPVILIISFRILLSVSGKNFFAFNKKDIQETA